MDKTIKTPTQMEVDIPPGTEFNLTFEFKEISWLIAALDELPGKVSRSGCNLIEQQLQPQLQKYIVKK